MQLAAQQQELELETQTLSVVLQQVLVLEMLIQ